MKLGRCRWTSIALLLVLAGGCSSKKGDASGTQNAVSGDQAPKWDERPSAVPADQPGVDDGDRAHLNLLNLAHLADVNQGGLFIDFGSPARMKYTAGNWKTGWGSDGKDADVTFTRAVSTTARVFLPIEQVGGATLRLRMKSVGTKSVMLFLNNKPLPTVTLVGDAFSNYDVAIPADMIDVGENHLLLRFGGTVKVGNEDVAVAMDSIRVLPTAAPPGDASDVLPQYTKLTRDVTIDGSVRKSIVLRGASRVSWYIDVPQGAKLSLGVGNIATAAPSPTPVNTKIVVTPEGGQATELYAGALNATWTNKVLPLTPFVGQVVRLDLVADAPATAEVAWASPAILVPKAPTVTPKQAHNVVVLLIDTMRADKLKPFNPATRVQTPVIDQIAREGTVFLNAQSPENWTKPSVASVLTGLYPMTHKAKESASRLADAALMVSEVFKQSGFSTATFLANGYVSDKFGFDQGWDHYTNYIRENKSTTAQNVFGETATWIEKHKAERFFVYIQTIDPHVPYDPPDEFLKLYDAEEYTGGVKPRSTADQLEQAKRNPPAITFTARDRQRLEALHDGEISYHDRQLGVFIERLKALGLYDNTLFVVVADHGEEFHDHGSWGHGHSVYQELLHVPFMARLPGAVPAGKSIRETVGTLDVSPTVLSAAGVAIPPVMEGVDRVGHMNGIVPSLPAVAFSDFLDDRRVIRAGRWKLIMRGVNTTLFDLESDPHELKELRIENHPIAMRYCRVLLGQFLGATDRRNWLAAEQGHSVNLAGEAAEMDEATKAGLKAIGYAN